MASGDFTVRFWGVRGSIPVPGPGTARYGGNTTCIEVRCGDRLIVFDAGTGARGLGLSLLGGPPADLDLFFTHTHWDHVAGLPFFVPAYDPRSTIRMWAGHLEDGRTLRDVLLNLMLAPLFPVPLQGLRASIAFNDFECGAAFEPAPGVAVRTGWLNHPNRAVGYRVEHAGRAFALITDTEHFADRMDESVVELARGADYMVYDSMYADETYPRHVGWGHSTWQEAIRVGEAAGVKRVVLFHHDPGHDDDAMDRIAEAAERMRPGTVVAREGMVLTL